MGGASMLFSQLVSLQPKDGWLGANRSAEAALEHSDLEVDMMSDVEDETASNSSRGSLVFSWHGNQLRSVDASRFHLNFVLDLQDVPVEIWARFTLVWKTSPLSPTTTQWLQLFIQIWYSDQPFSFMFAFFPSSSTRAVPVSVPTQHGDQNSLFQNVLAEYLPLAMTSTVVTDLNGCSDLVPPLPSNQKPFTTETISTSSRSERWTRHSGVETAPSRKPSRGGGRGGGCK